MISSGYGLIATMPPQQLDSKDSFTNFWCRNETNCIATREECFYSLELMDSRGMTSDRSRTLPANNSLKVLVVFTSLARSLVRFPRCNIENLWQLHHLGIFLPAF